MTANIGTLMDLYGVEKGLEHYRSTQSLTFDQYIYYLQKEVRSLLKCMYYKPKQYEYEINVNILNYLKKW